MRMIRLLSAALLAAVFTLAVPGTSHTGLLGVQVAAAQAAPAAPPLDINTATRDQLKALPGNRRCVCGPDHQGPAVFGEDAADAAWDPADGDVRENPGHDYR